VVAEVIIIVGDENVEHHAPEQFDKVRARIRTVAFERVSQICVAVATDIAFVGSEDRQT
jgi:hypothetical protein